MEQGLVPGAFLFCIQGTEVKWNAGTPSIIQGGQRQKFQPWNRETVNSPACPLLK